MPTRHMELMAAWRRLQTAPEGDPGLASLDDLEKQLLCHTPSAPSEAADVIEVVRVSLTQGGRIDGLDAGALSCIQLYLAKLPQRAGIAA